MSISAPALRQRIDHAEEGEAPKSGVPRAYAADAVFAHQDGNVQVVHLVSADLRKFLNCPGQYGRVTPGRDQQLNAWRVEEVGEKTPGVRGSLR